MDWISPAISALSIGCAIFFGWAAFARTQRKDTENDAQITATVLTELGHVKGGVEDIKSELREQRKTNTEVLTRLTAVESSAAQAHKRLDLHEKVEHGYDMPKGGR